MPAVEVVACAPEKRTFVTAYCAVLVGSREEAGVTHRLAVSVVVVAAVPVRDASVLSPKDFRVLARHHRA